MRPPTFAVAGLAARARPPIRPRTGLEGRPLNRDLRRRVWRRLRDLRRPSARRGFQPCLKHGAFAVAEALLNVFLNKHTGRLDPSLATLARAAGVCRDTAQRAVKRLEALGVLAVTRRYVMARDGAGVLRPRRTSNAYVFRLPAGAGREQDRAADHAPAHPHRRPAGEAHRLSQPRLPFESDTRSATEPRIISRRETAPAPAATALIPELQRALARLGHSIADLSDNREEGLTKTVSRRSQDGRYHRI